MRGMAAALAIALGFGTGAAPAQEAGPDIQPETLGEAIGPIADVVPVSKTDVSKTDKAAKDCKPGFGCVTNLPLPRYVSLKGDEGNARRGPGLTHRIDWVFTRPGMPLKITAEFDNWRRVEDQDGAGGWVHYALLSGVRSVVVTLDMAELRASPDDRSAVVAQAEMGVIGRVQECSPTWCRIQAGGERGWVMKSALWGVGADEIVE